MNARTAVWIGAAVALVVAVPVSRALGGRETAPHTHSLSVSPDANTGPGLTPMGPTAVVARAPSGFRHDAAGATAAALGFLSMGPAAVNMDEAAAIAAQRQMATSGAAEAMTVDLRSRLAAMHDGFGPGPIGYRVAPLAVRTDQADADHVDVAVWYVAVVEPRAGSAYADWRIVRYQLVWERSDWREAAEHDEPGPRPIPMTVTEPTPPAAWAAQLEGFNPVGGGHV